MNKTIEYLLIMRTLILLSLYLLLFNEFTSAQITIEHISTHNLNRIKFLSPVTGIAVGDSGTILITSDSGNVWTQIISPTTQTLRDICFLDDSIAFIVGGGYNQSISEYEGVILRSSDSGNSWHILHGLSSGYLNAIEFLSDSNGYAVGAAHGTALNYTGLIIKTTNGGIDWFDLDSGTYLPLYCIQFPDDTTGYIGGGELSLKTTDAGNTWINQTSGGYWPDNLDLHFFDINNGFEFGDAIIHTTDGGENWEFIGNEIAFLGFQSVYFLNNSEAVAVGDHGLFRYSSDGGFNWSDIEIGISDYLYSVDIPLRDKGFAVGSSGVLVKFNIDSLYIVSSLGEDNISVANYNLYQNYPNPFNPQTTIAYSIGKAGYVVLKIYDILGNEVGTLVDRYQGEGQYSVVFNGSKYPSGVYFYRMKAGDFMQIKKLIYLK